MSDPLVAIDVPDRPLSPGSTSVAPVRVANTGSTVESYRIEVLGAAREWATTPAKALALFPGASGETTVTLAPPRRGGPPAGPLRVGLRVVGESDPDARTVVEFDVVIAPFIDFTATLVPVTSRGWRRSRHRITLTNNGNTDASIALRPHDADERLGFRVPARVQVPAGRAATAPLAVRAQSARFFGRRETHPFELEVLPEGAEPIVLAGALRQRALMAPGAVVATVATVAVLAVLLAFRRTDLSSVAQDEPVHTVSPAESLSRETTTSTTPAPVTDTTATAVTTTVTASATDAEAAPGPLSPAAPSPKAPATTAAKGTHQAATAADAPADPSAAAAPLPAAPAPTPAAASTPDAPSPASPPPSAAPPPTVVPHTTPMRLGPTYAGDGVIYAVALNGDLLFFQDLRQDGTSNGTTGEGWSPAGGSKIGCGFGSFQHLIGAEGGVLYGVDGSGTLRWYKDLARDGSNDACNGGGQWAGGTAMAGNWSGYQHMFYGGNGIIYAVDAGGDLHFCQDVGLDGTLDTPVCPVIATGWGDFLHLFASGRPGVIYGVRTNGDLEYFRDTLRNGTNGTAGAGWVGPLPVGNGWQGVRHVFGGAIGNPIYPSGVVYAVAEDYNLQWRRDILQDGSNGWNGVNGWLGVSIVGTSWNVL